ncbi:MAG: DUF934 domain-containing protein [Methylophilaceae bacterium]|nr:DUF934 domain-containing protein [Methylophilaceae bacterium]
MSNLIRNNAIVENEWISVALPAGEETVRKQAGKVVLFKLTGEKTTTPEQIAATVIPENGKILVPLSVWESRKSKLASRLQKGELGICLDTHELLENLVASIDDINQLPLIAVHVERFADGRIFSIGNLLRTRYGYKNELRAFGDVLRDQLFFLKRCGYDSYLIRADRSAEDALASLKDFTQPYQGAVDDALPVWRRVNRGAQ